MALKNYTNNNERQITNTTYSSVSFSNPNSSIMASKVSISYFNRLMKFSIALRNNAGSNDQYATYDNDNAISVYISNIKAHILSQMIDKFIADPSIHNVCIELKNGLLKISDGAEYKSKNTCISISYADENGNVNEVVYECKTDYHTAAYNYSNGSFSTETFPNIELDTIKMVLDEYYAASSYAIAASVMEANMYKRNSQYELIRSIADKVGVQTGNGGRQFNNKTFLSNGNNNGGSGSNANNGALNGSVPSGYEASSFDEIANNM